MGGILAPTLVLGFEQLSIWQGTGLAMLAQPLDSEGDLVNRGLAVERQDILNQPVVDVAAPLAALGTTITVPTLDGDVPLEVPAGTQPGETIALVGHAS